MIEKTDLSKDVRVDADLQDDHEEKVEVGHPLELFKQRHGQESQQGVLVAAHRVVLATSKTQSDAQTTELFYDACFRTVKQELV